MKRIATVVLCLALMITSISQMAVIALAAGTPTITCTSKECYPGDTVTVEVNLENNPGIMYLEITPTYSSELGTPIVQNGSIISDLTKGKQYIWVADNDVNTNGTLVTFTFRIAEDIVPDDYSVEFIFRSAYNYNEESVTFTAAPATISVKAKSVSVTGLALDKTSATVETGDATLALTPIFSPENATNKNLIWSSDNENVATVKDGVVTPIKKGVVTITASTEDGEYTASCVVTVNCSHRKGNHYPAESSTCIKQGHEAYDVCEECGEIINGSDAKLPLADHTYDENTDAQYLKTPAACNSKAVYYKSCSVCGEKNNETFEHGEFDSNNHISSTYIKNQKEATCYEEGYTGDTYCSDCNTKIASGIVIEKDAHNPASVWSTDEGHHWKDCQTVGCGNIIDKAAHSGGEPTCAKKAICTVCGVEYGAVNVDNHKNTEIRDVLDATCTTDGYTGDTYCKDCGVKTATGEILPAKHKLDKVEAKEATHEVNGNIEYYSCAVCGKLFADSGAAQEIALEDTVVAKGEHNYSDTYKTDAENHWKECSCGNTVEKAAHSFGVWTVVKEATDSDDGSKERDCSVCGYKESKMIPAVEAPDMPDETADLTDTNKAPAKTPQTGDTSNLTPWIVLMFVSAAGAGIITVYNRKKRVQ